MSTVCKKFSKYGVICGLYFPVFGLKTNFYSVNSRIQCEYRKIKTRNNSVFGQFSCSVSHVLLDTAKTCLSKTIRKINTIYYFRRCDVIVSKLDSDEVPDRDPRTYNDDDIREGIDGLYVAIRKAGAPKKGMEIVIGGDFNYRYRLTLDGKSLHF